MTKKKAVLEGTFFRDYNIENGRMTLEFHGAVDGIQVVGGLEGVVDNQLHLKQGRNDTVFRITVEVLR